MPSLGSRDKIDEIKNRLDVVDVIGKDIQLHSNGNGQYVGSVPPIGKSGKSLKVDKHRQLWNDTKNGKGGDVIDWIGRAFRDPKGTDFHAVLEIAAGMAGVELDHITEHDRDAAKEKSDIHNIFTESVDVYHNNLTHELYDRINEKWGINKETVDNLKIGYATPGRDLADLDKTTLKKSGLVYVNNGMMGGEVFSGRIIFPYWRNGKVVYLIGRATEETPKLKDGDEPPKYQKLLVHKEGREYVSPSVQNSYFYGEDSLRGSDYCIITEGVADCIVMQQAGFPCISPVTVQFREKDHAKLISLTTGLKRVYICNDTEANGAGLKGALSTADALEESGIEARLIQLPKPDGVDKIDIADYMKDNKKEAFKHLMDSSVGLWTYKLNQQAIPETSTSLDRLRLCEQFINELSPMKPNEREIFIKNDVAEKFNLKAKDIKNFRGTQPEKSNILNNSLSIDKEFDGLYTLQWNSENTRIIDILLHFDKIALKALETLNTISYKGQIYVNINGYYESTEEIVMKEITRIINGIRKGSFSSGIKNSSANVLHNILYFNPIMDYPFNNENMAIPFKNGIVLLDFENKTKKLIPHSPEYKFNYMLQTDYKEDADPKPINDILMEYSPEHVDELYQLPAQALMQMLGYGPFKKCYLLQGNRDAGKSSYIELLLRAFGKRNRCDVSLEMLNPKENKFAMSSLEGKMFNIHDDMTYFSMKDTGTIKDLTGSYTKEIEKKGMQRYGADIRAVHCFACNKPPKYDEEIKKDIAFWERWVYIYFPNRFEKLLTFYDDNFTPDNLSGFLNKVLDYVLDIGHDKKLVCNYNYAEIRATWAKCADPIYRFINENMTLSKNPMYYYKEDVLDTIKEWARDQGEGEDEEIPTTIIMLSKSIAICGGDIDARITEEKSGMEQRVYGLPYTWKEDSLYKDKIPVVIPRRKQSKF